MTNTRKFFCAVSILLVISAVIRAEILPFKKYTVTDGLAHDRVNRIIRDSRGFLWFCTGEGLSRFDGYEFKNYTRDRGLPHRGVYDLLETHDGRFWIATGDGLVLFDPKGDEHPEKAGSQPMFRVFRPGPESPKNKAFPVSDLIQDRGGRLWVAASEGLYRLEREGEDWALRRVDRSDWQLQSTDFTAVLEDTEGALWLGTLRGLSRLLPDETLQKLSPELRVGSFLQDSKGRIWVGSQGGESSGLYQYSISAAVPQLVRIFGQQDGLAADNWMNALMETADGTIYAGVGNGLCKLVISANGSPGFKQLSVQDVVSLAQDISGNVWIGTGSSGAHRLAQHGFTAFDKTDGLTNMRITSIAPSAPDGETYITAGDTIYRFNKTGFTGVTPRNAVKVNWGSNHLTFQDHTGEWWIPGTKGLQRYPEVSRLEDLANTSPKHLYTTADGLFDNSVFQLFEDSRGDIWISIISDPVKSLMRFERSTGKIYPYTPNDGRTMPYSCPTAFAEDRAGNIWIGFYAGGLIRYRNGKFENVGGELLITSGMIRDIHMDRSGRVWIATSTGGVVRIDDPVADEPALHSITTREGLSSSQASCLAEDNFGNIYVGTGRGVSQVSVSADRIKLFDTSDGLPGNLITTCGTDAKGALWFGTNNGPARYVPSEEVESSPPRIFIGDLRANGINVRRISELGESAIDNVVLASDQRQIQIDFLALGFAAGENLRYQYKIGQNADWSEPTLQRTVNLTLSPGSYQFLVRAVSADGKTSENPASVAFAIAAPVWQRWWFMTLAVMLTALAAYIVYKYRVMHLVKLERVRTRIASDLHDDIGSSLSQIAILSEVAQRKAGNDANGIAEPLSLIAGTSRKMMDSMSDIVWAINPKKDHLSDLLQRMRRFAEDTLDAQEIENTFIVPETSRNVALGADLRREIYLAFKECINNLVKHSGATEAKIVIDLGADLLSIEIADNGCGFDAETRADNFGGNGLANIRRRMENVKGALSIESNPGRGATILLRVPVARKIFVS